MRKEKEKEEILEALADMVNQHCSLPYKDGEAYNPTKDSMALSANAHAIRVLAKHGRFKIKQEYGRRIVGKLIEK